MLDSTNEQAENLDRVSARIAHLIISFCRDRLKADRPSFHMVELTSWIARHYIVAPDSPGRILRDLKAKGRISYDLVSRRSSHYCLKAVAL